MKRKAWKKKRIATMIEEQTEQTDPLLLLPNSQKGSRTLTLVCIHFALLFSAFIVTR